MTSTVGLPSDELPFEYSLYHFYIWKERQTLIREESVRKYELTNEKTYGADKTIPGTLNPKNNNNNNNKAQHTDDDDNSDDDVVGNRNEVSLFEKSCKYRRIWNFIARLFPEIAIEFSVDQAASTVPEVYRRYTEFSKLEAEIKVLRQKRHIADDTTEEAQRKRARIEVIYPWRQTKGNQARNDESAPTTAHSSRTRAALVLSDNYTTSTNEADKCRFEKYIQTYKSEVSPEVTKDQFFMESCEHLKAFKRKDGMFAVSQKRHTLVFEWVSEIIKLVRTNKLTTSQLDKLLSIGFVAKRLNNNNGYETEKDYTGSDNDDNDEDENQTTLNDVRWNERFQELAHIYKIHGHFVMPRNAPGDRSMSNWVYHQRFLYRENNLSSDKVKKLESIGFSWDTSRRKPKRKYVPKDVEYFINFVDEERYQEEKQLLEPNSAIHPRDSYVRPKDENKANSNNELTWYKQFLELVEYKEIYGHTRIPKPKEQNDPWRLVYFWVEAQKKYYRNNTLVPHRTQSLRNLGVGLPIPKKPGEGPRYGGRTSLDATANEGTTQETNFLSDVPVE